MTYWMPERKERVGKFNIASSKRDTMRIKSGTMRQDSSMQRKYSKTSTAAIRPSHASNDDNEIELHSQHGYTTPSSSARLRQIPSKKLTNMVELPQKLTTTDSNLSDSNLSDSDVTNA